MVQQFPHHVVEPPDFFNPFYLLVNDVSAKMRPIFSVSTRLFMSFSLLPAFPFFLHPHGFFTLSRHSFPRARLFFVSLHSQGRHTHHSHSYELPIASFSPTFSLFSALSLPPGSLLRRPFTLHSRFIFRSPPRIRRTSFSALFFLRAQHVFPPAHFLSLAPPPPALPRSARSPLPIFYPLSLFLSTSLFSSFARLGIKKHYLSKRRALFLCSFPLPFPCRFSAPFTYLFHSPSFFLFSGPKSRACFSGEFPLGAPLLTKRRICSKIKKKKIDFIKESILL